MSVTEEKQQLNFDLKTNEGIKNSILGYLRAMFKKVRNGEDVEASITVIMAIFAKAFMERESIKYNEKDPIGSLVTYLKNEKFTNGDDAELEDDKGLKLVFSLDRKPGSTRLFLLSSVVTEENNIMIEYGDGESIREKNDDEKTIRDGATYLIFRDENGVIEHLYLQKDKTFKYFGNGKPRADQPHKERPPRTDSSHTQKKEYVQNSSTNATDVIKALVEQNEKLMKLVANSVAGSSKGKGKAQASPKH